MKEINKKQNILNSFSLFLAFVLFFFLFKELTHSYAKTNFDEFGLGEGTSSYAPVLNNYPIQAIHSLKEIGEIKTGWQQRHHKQTLLWLGNSQLHGINQYKKGDRNAVEALHIALQPNGKDVIAFSLPNANLQEHYLLFAYFVEHFQLNQLLIPVFLDDTRENGIRNTLVDVPIDQATRQVLASTSIGERILEQTADNTPSATSSASSETSGIRATIQEKAETAITGWLTAHSQTWRSREQARGDIYLLLYNTRNKIFGIRPESQRKIIPANYQANMAAFESILSLAQQKNIQVQVYIPPIRNDISLPYDPKEYSSFKQYVSELCKKHNAAYVNLEKTVPDQYWKINKPGKNGASTLDFMHFEAPGHEILADTLFNHLQTSKR